MAALCAAIFLTMIHYQAVAELPWQDVKGFLSAGSPVDEADWYLSTQTNTVGGWLAVDRRIVGSSLIVRNPSGQLEIGKVSVDPAYRRQGIAGSLLRHCLREAADLDERVILISERSNTAAGALYEKLGFLMTDEVPHDQTSNDQFVVWTHPRLIAHGPVTARTRIDDGRFRYLVHLATDAKGSSLKKVLAHISDLHILSVGSRAFLAWALEEQRAVIEYMAAARPHRGDGTALIDALRWAVPGREIIAVTDDDAVGFYRNYGFAVRPAPQDSRWPGRPRYICALQPVS